MAGITSLITARDIIQLALRSAGVLGVGRAAQPEDIRDGLTLLNYMLARWSSNRWLVYALVDQWTLGNGGETYQVGPGADFDYAARPNRIERAYVRLGGGGVMTPHEFTLDRSALDSADVLAPAISSSSLIDFPLRLIGSYEEYVDIGLKNQQSFPICAFYNPTHPLGTLYIWPVASPNYELHILARVPLTGITSPNDTVQLPPEYYEAIHYNLVVRLASAYGLQPSPVASTLALTGLQTIRAANTQVVALSMPSALLPFRSNAAYGYGFGGFVGVGALPAGISGTVTTPDVPPVTITGTPYTTSDGLFITDSSGNLLTYANPYTASPLFIVGVTPLDSGAVWAA